MQASETDHANDAEFDLVIDEAIEVLQETLIWVHTAAHWVVVGPIIEAMTDAVRSRDLVALREATINLDLVGPVREIPKNLPAGTGAEPPLQRINQLVHELDQAKSAKKPKGRSS